MTNGKPSLAWSDFARGRYVSGGSHSYCQGGEDALLELVADHWTARRPGRGREDLGEVVVVPVPADGFVCGTVRVEEATPLQAKFVRRQAQEEGFVKVYAAGPREPALHAAVVLYSAAALLRNGGRRSSEADWEVVSIIAAPVPDEPMDPLTMARNMLAKAGGTPCTYTAEQFAEAIWYWAARADILPDDA